MSTVAVANLTKSYSGAPALKGVSFQVEPAETFALLGPNGAGKTTCLEILEGYRTPDGGEARVLDMNPATGGRRFRESIGLVLQVTSLELELTARETVSAFSKYYPKPLNVDEVIDIVGLGHAAAKRVKALSGGQQRRLEIALGIIGDPAVIFLDEPTTGLDPDARRKIWQLILDLNSRGKTILLSSHYMDEVEALAHRLAVMKHGEIIAEGSPAQLQDRFSDHAVIRFGLSGNELPDDFPGPLRQLVEVSRGWATLRARDPAPVLADLTNWAFRHRYDLSSITVARPSLEDIYLKLTGDGEGAR